MGRVKRRGGSAGTGAGGSPRDPGGGCGRRGADWRSTPDSGGCSTDPGSGLHVTPLWIAIIIAAVGCYLLKLAGVSLPESILNQPKVQRVAELLPIAMLSALVAVELLDGGGRYALD